MRFIQVSILIFVCSYCQANLPYKVASQTSSTPRQCTILEAAGKTTLDQYKRNLSETFSRLVPPSHCRDHKNFWTRVAYLSMTDSFQTCPSAWEISGASIRACGRQSSSNGSCDSVFYSTNGLSYSHVCGCITGFQYETPNAFNSSVTGNVSLDSWYVDGVSLTHGQPGHRTHVWTFANAWYVTASNDYKCPCMLSNSSYWPYTVPSFVGSNYFCATGSYSSPGSSLLTNDLLWDGVGCTGNNTCCQFNQPPWFCRTLPTATSDDLEVRICGDQQTTNENTYVSYIELYVA